MRTLGAFAVALAVATLGLQLAMPSLSNGGLLSGYEFFGLLVVGACCVAAYYAVAKVRAGSNVAVLVQSLVVGLSSPFVVLVAPLAFCIAFRPGAACV